MNAAYLHLRRRDKSRPYWSINPQAFGLLLPIDPDILLLRCLFELQHKGEMIVVMKFTPPTTLIIVCLS